MGSASIFSIGISFLLLLGQGCQPFQAPQAVKQNENMQMPFRSGKFSKANSATAETGEVLKLEFALLAKQRVGESEIAYFRAEVDFATGKMSLVGGQTPYIEETLVFDDLTAAVSISSDEYKTCRHSVQLEASDLQELRDLLGGIRSCKVSDDLGMVACPEFAYLEPEKHAEIAIIGQVGSNYYSRNLCLIAQAPKIKTLCRDEVEIEGLLAAQIEEKAFSPENCRVE